MCTASHIADRRHIHSIFLHFKNRMGEYVVVTINLKDFYFWYDQDEYIEISGEIAAELFADKRYNKTFERTTRRNKVYSLDADDGNAEEAASIHSSDNPENVFEMMETHCRLCRSLNALPEVQGRRIEAHFINGMSRKEIATAESVSMSSINESIERGLRTMYKNFFNESTNCIYKKLFIYLG